jgi:hypothetical protein
MFDKTYDARVRSAAFEWLSSQVAAYGDVLPRVLLARGFVLEGARVPLMGPQGIFKPRILQEVPLSITTAPEGPYDDAFGGDGLLRYRYRGTNPDHVDNRGHSESGFLTPTGISVPFADSGTRSCWTPRISFRTVSPRANRSSETASLSARFTMPHSIARFLAYDRTTRSRFGRTS